MINLSLDVSVTLRASGSLIPRDDSGTRVSAAGGAAKEKTARGLWGVCLKCRVDYYSTLDFALLGKGKVECAAQTFENSFMA